jgi:ribosome-associated toxin RatA of RatAB toxin-antitoxin module
MRPRWRHVEARMMLHRFFTLAALAAAALLTPLRAAQAQPGSRIERPTDAELVALRPVAERGAAGLVDYPDAGPGARITVAVPVAAPLAQVRHALLDAERWPEYMPALRSVALLSRRGRRAAFRFEVAASLLDVTATTSLVEVGERRVDFSVLESDFGVAAARWDLLDDGPGRTLLVITTWSDPSQGHWLLRQASRANLTSIAGMNVAVDLVLALSVARRAMSLAGVAMPARPARTSAPPDELAPPAAGPWFDLASGPRRYYVYSFALAPDGAVAQATVMHQTWGRADVLQSRIDDVARYRDVVPGVRASEPAGDATEDTARAQLTLSSPFDSADGVMARRRVAPGVVTLEGESGSLAPVRWRWDVIRDAQRGTIVELTSAVNESLASTIVRAAAGREPYLHAGLAALRELVWLRYMLAGLPFA